MAKKKHEPTDKSREAVETVRVQHGPSAPAKTIHGPARLRAVLRVSDGVTVDDLCDEAAATIERLQHERPARATWRE